MKISETDEQLVALAVGGGRPALEKLITKNQAWVYNIALNMTSDHALAADITQEVLIKVITKLSTFKAESSFRTWLFKIVKNHFLNTKRSCPLQISFDDFAKGLDKTNEEALNYSNPEKQLIVEEAKLSCMKAMLLCLDLEQRLVFILGELFELPDSIGSEILEITRENFRVKLHRAKTQLYNFMNDKCGLINKNNPCRCERKTAGFIKAGYVDPVNRYFQRNRLTSVGKIVKEKVAEYEEKVIPTYQSLFQQHPFLEAPDALNSIKKLISSEEIKSTFQLKG